MLSYTAEEFTKSVKQVRKESGKTLWNTIKQPEFIITLVSLIMYIICMYVCGAEKTDYPLIYYTGAVLCCVASVLSSAIFQKKKEKEDESFYNSTLKAIWIPRIENHMKNLGVSFEACVNTLKDEIENEICKKEKHFERISHITAETLKLLFIAPAGFLFGLIINSLYTESVSDMKAEQLLDFSIDSLRFAILIAVCFLPICGLIIIIAVFWDLFYTMFSEINLLENCVSLLNDIATHNNQKGIGKLKRSKKAKKSKNVLKKNGE